MLSLSRAEVQPLVEELRSHMPGKEKKKKECAPLTHFRDGKLVLSLGAHLSQLVSGSTSSGSQSFSPCRGQPAVPSPHQSGSLRERLTREGSGRLMNELLSLRSLGSEGQWLRPKLGCGSPLSLSSCLSIPFYR